MRGATRENLQYARFNAHVIISSEDQKDLGNKPLKKIPATLPGEIQLPSGEGMAPPVQDSLDGLMPDMPALPANAEGDE